MSLFISPKDDKISKTMIGSRSIRHIFILILAALALVSSNPLEDYTSEEFIQVALKGQNDFRVPLGLQKFVWNKELAQGSQQWAEHMAAANKMSHSHGPYGENVSYGSTSNHGLADLIVLWTNEKRHYIPKVKFPKCSTTGSSGAVDHYTQIVWRNTLEVGCGLGRNARNSFLCCRYLTVGNYIGEVPY